MTDLAPSLEAFFTQRLMAQRRVSPHTIAAYRDAFRLLLGFAQQRTGTRPDRLSLADLDAPLVGAFLDHLERDRGVAVTTATPGWRRCTRSFAMRRCAIPSTPVSSSGSSPSRPNAPAASRSPT